ncbi:hypothetical protein PIB30_026599 [Stylosanthes scabra]|uniref:Uncharacterized protein n=1 Tax=Stylosanthes scabra TaxID=79078 RepID=A0ABU6U9A3_9FABA|nr:hypothetical protein [Stylosanthes scabra]
MITRSLDCPPTEPELFRETQTRKRDRSIVEKRADDLLFSVNLEQATQQAQKEGDDSAGTIDLNSVWRQTLSKPCRNWVYGAGRFFASSLHISASEDIDEVRSLKDTLDERDARAEEHLRRMEEMSRQIAAFYNPLRPGSSATVGIQVLRLHRHYHLVHHHANQIILRSMMMKTTRMHRQASIRFPLFVVNFHFVGTCSFSAFLYGLNC